MFKAAIFLSCCDLSTISYYTARSNDSSQTSADIIMPKRVRFSLELEEVRCFIPVKKSPKTFAKALKKLGTMTQSLRDKLDYKVLIIQDGLENMKKHVQKLRSQRRKGEAERIDYNWDELFEIYCTQLR